MRSRASTEPLRKTVFSSLPVLFGAFLALLLGTARTVSPQTTPTAPTTQAAPATPTTPKQHSIAVQFVYDFRAHQGCPAKSPCVKQFNVYNVTDHGGRILLFNINAPPNARGKAVHVSGQSMPRPYASGQHMIAVTAQWDTGAESDLLACTTLVEVQN